MMPSTISSTTAGIRSRGTSDTRSGAANAMAATASRDVNERLPAASTDENERPPTGTVYQNRTPPSRGRPVRARATRGRRASVVWPW